ncbi:hypothetical protein [Streptomyces sp. NPDC058045]|uniref:hypothetical protein n=1 Tax=Streptomyces sp. NPDC058045 TaxID=3346311 RepID=UPI0036E90AA2
MFADQPGGAMDHEAMFVRTERLPHSPRWPMTVRVHTSVGSAVVLWCGDPREADGHHLVEWTVDEDLHWGRNTLPAAAGPELRQDGGRVLMTGRLRLAEEGAACLRLGPWPVLFDLAAPVPGGVDGAWVRISAASQDVALHPYRI